MRGIESFFKDRIISKNFWPPRSPDLTPADFFLWGLLKGKVYKNTPCTIEQFKEAIHQEIQAVNPDTLGKVFQNLEKRIQVCLGVKGDQFQHRLWAGPILLLSRYVYINFQVIISITYFFIDNGLGPLATESPRIKILIQLQVLAIELAKSRLHIEGKKIKFMSAVFFNYLYTVWWWWLTVKTCRWNYLLMQVVSEGQTFGFLCCYYFNVLQRQGPTLPPVQVIGVCILFHQFKFVLFV